MVKTVNSALPEGAAFAHATLPNTALEETSTVEQALQTQASDRQFQADVKTVIFPSLLFTFDHDRMLVRKVAVY